MFQLPLDHPDTITEKLNLSKLETCRLHRQYCDDVKHCNISLHHLLVREAQVIRLWRFMTRLLICYFDGATKFRC